MPMTYGMRNSFHLTIRLTILVLLYSLASAAEPSNPLPRYVPSAAELAGANGRANNPRNRARAYKLQLVPHWNEAGTTFWYVNELPGGAREFWRVEAETGARTLAFDHTLMIAALTRAGVQSAPRLPLHDLNFTVEGKSFEFRIGRTIWQCSLPEYTLTEVDRPSPPAKLSRDVPQASRTQGIETHVTFSNKTKGEVELFWVDSDSRRHSYGKIAAGASVR